MSVKTYVSISARFDTVGNIHPSHLHWYDGRCFEIDRIEDVRPCASLKCGGFGTKYTCRISGKEVILFFEDNRWFIER